MDVNSRIFAYIIAIIGVVVFGILGTLYFGGRGGFNVPVKGVVGAAYFTMATVSTVGYGDIYPITSSARLFVIALIVIGIGVFFGAIVSIFGEFMESRIERISGRMTAIWNYRLLNVSHIRAVLNLVRYYVG